MRGLPRQLNAACPANRDHPLNDPATLKLWLLAGAGDHPRYYGGNRWFGLVGGNDATLQGTPGWTAQNPRSGNPRSVGFDGSTQYGSLLTTIHTSERVSVALSFMTTAVDTFHCLYSCYNGNSDSFEIMVTGDPGLFGGNYTLRATLTSGIAVNTWYHVVVTQEPASAIQIYLNGVAVGTPGTSLFSTFGAAHSIGCRGTLEFPLSGQLDDIRVYSNRLLSATEVSYLYSQWLTGNPDLLNWTNRTWLLQGATAPGDQVPYQPWAQLGPNLAG